jgi:hypothetical protein
MAVFRTAALLRRHGLYVSNAAISLEHGLGAVSDEIPGSRSNQVPFQFRLNFRGLSPAIRPVAGLAEMLHKNAEPAANEQNFGH